MTRSPSDIDELKNLQREAAELREKRKRTRPKGRPEKDVEPEPDEEPEDAQPLEPDLADDPFDDSDDEASGLAGHLETVVQELEVLAKNHPTLALVSAFTIGFFAGKLFTRR